MDTSVFFIDQNIPYLADILSGCGRTVRFDGRTLSAEYLQNEHCTALFVRSVTNVNAALLQQTNVRFVGTATAGTDHIDFNYLHSSGINVASAAGSNANAVAEYTLFAMLEWARNNQSILKGKRVGIIGFGNVGKRVADYCNRLNMKIVVNDPPLFDIGFPFPDWVEYAEIEQLCSKCDIITNHVPLTLAGNYSTLGLLGIRELSHLQSGTLLIHSSRGGVIDEAILLEISENKKLTLVIDVWNNEPLINVQLAKKSIIATPHIAGYSWNAKLEGTRIIAEKFAEFSGCSLDFSMMNDTLPELLNPNCTNQTTIYTTLNERRQFLQDTHNLRQTFNLSPAQRAKAFDQLRKQYPQRFESLQ